MDVFFVQNYRISEDLPDMMTGKTFEQELLLKIKKDQIEI